MLIKQKVHKFINSHTFNIIGNWIIATYRVQSLEQNIYILKISNLFTKKNKKKNSRQQEINSLPKLIQTKETSLVGISLPSMLIYASPQKKSPAYLK